MNEVDNSVTRLIVFLWKLDYAGKGSAAAAGNTERSDDGAVGGRLGVSAAQSVFQFYSLSDILRRT